MIKQKGEREREREECKFMKRSSSSFDYEGNSDGIGLLDYGQSQCE